MSSELGSLIVSEKVCFKGRRTHAVRGADDLLLIHPPFKRPSNETRALVVSESNVPEQVAYTALTVSIIRVIF